MHERAAFRAVYLASPLKFCTTLHAFAPVLPRYFINAWEKDPWKWQHHKYRRSRERNRGKWFYGSGPLGGVQLPGWPEPGLLGARGLVEVAQKGQVERLEDQTFWHQVAERAVTLRDVMAVGDLAVILDTLLTANHRHTHLMKTLSRELIDDVDKLSLVEAAVILNAYAHFNCESRLMLKSFAEHIARLLQERPYTTVDADERFGSEAAHPQTLAVLCKAFASLKYQDSEMLRAVNEALVDRIQDANFNSVADILAAFAELEAPFEAPVEFWVTLANKVGGTPMRFLSPTLRALDRLQVSEPGLSEALGNEVLARLQEVAVPQVPPAAPPLRRLPALFVELPTDLLRQGSGSASSSTSPEPKEVMDDVFEVMPSALVDTVADEDEEDDDAQAASKRKRRRWYNAVSRKLDVMSLDSLKVPYYAPFDPDLNYQRNLRGARVAQALEGLDTLAGASPPAAAGGAEPRSVEAELLSSAEPLVAAGVQGLSPQQLVLAAELFMGRGEEATVRSILRESLRRMSNFSLQEIRRLNSACEAAGVSDPYLDRARKRRFPKALRKELRLAAQ